MYAAVTNVRKTKTLGDKTANGEFYVVKVKVSSDARRAALGLITVDAQVADDNNRRFTRDTKAENRLGEQPPFEKRIVLNETVEKEIVFDLPTDAANPSLDLREGCGIDYAVESVFIGDVDSVFMKSSAEKARRISSI